MAHSVKRIRYVEYLLTIVAGIILFNVCALGVHRWTCMNVLGAILGIGLVVSYFLRFVKNFSRDVTNFVVLKSETGSVRVHASAIEEALRHTAKSLPEVHDVRVRLVIDKQTSVPSAGEVDARIRDITNIVTLNQYTSVFLLVTVEGGSTWIFDP